LDKVKFLKGSGKFSNPAERHSGFGLKKRPGLGTCEDESEVQEDEKKSIWVASRLNRKTEKRPTN